MSALNDIVICVIPKFCHAIHFSKNDLVDITFLLYENEDIKIILFFCLFVCFIQQLMEADAGTHNQTSSCFKEK